MQLLLELYRTHSASGHERAMVELIRRWVRDNVPAARVAEDHRNLYITKGRSATYPCLVAHTDQVQPPYPPGYAVVHSGNLVYAFDRATGLRCGLGADDKNGVWIALDCLARYPVLKCAFFWGEEIGCLGSRQAILPFFDDCRWVVQCDRRGNADFITDIGGRGLCSQRFIDDCDLTQHHYATCRGLSTDVGELKASGLRVSCANISCGYHDPHTDHEYTLLPGLHKCQRLVAHAIERLTDVYPHTPPTHHGHARSAFWLTGLLAAALLR